MKCFKIIVIVFGIIACPICTMAQSYEHAIGLKLGSPFGLSYKHFLNDINALEIHATAWPAGPRGTALFEWQKTMKNPRFSWFYGTGAHLQLYTLTSIGPAERFRFNSKKGYGVGVEGIIGIEYKIRESPFTSDLSLKPNFELTSFGQYAINYDPSLTFRYILK